MRLTAFHPVPRCGDFRCERSEQEIGRARKELRFKNLSVLNYLLHGETTVSPTPFDTLELAPAQHCVGHNVEDGCELQSESLL